MNDLLLSVFLILPGFLVERVRRSAKEYESYTVFETTIVSLGFSIIIFVFAMLTINYNVFVTNISNQSFVELVNEIVDNKTFLVNMDKFLYAFISYLVVAISLTNVLFCSAWINFGYRVRELLNLTRRTKHLTPWDDYLEANKMRWISASLNDGRTIVGRASITSHSPFKHELILTSEKENPIEIYQNSKILETSIPIETVYIPGDSIKSLESYTRSTELTVNLRSKVFLFIEIILLISVMLLSIKTSHIFSTVLVYQHNVTWEYVLFIILWIVSILLSLGFLQFIDDDIVTEKNK